MKGKLFLILGPSGSGKGTVIRYLKKHSPEFVFPTSCTTREPRPGEKEGDIYHYVSKDEFKKRIKDGEFLEYAIVHGDNYYGTLEKPIEAALEDGKTVIREVDMQGVESIRELLPKGNVVTIFITVPTWEELKQRILGRHEETDEEIAQRKESWEKEMAFREKMSATEHFYVVPNPSGQSDECISKVVDIIQKETVQ